MAISSKITILFYQEDGDWVAHALEFDIIGVGATLEEAYSVLERLLVFYIQDALEKGLEDTLYHPAPDKYFRLLKDAKRLDGYESDLGPCHQQVEAYASAAVTV